jgi:urea carboxylase
MSAVRDDAPWCPDNIEFIRRINGLPDAAAVENLIFEANTS